MKRIVPGLTYANVVATLALFLALGGVGYAASQLPKNSVGAQQLKKHAVTPAKLSKASKKTLTGPGGEKGEPGQPGAAGSAKAWAEVSSTGAVVRSSPGLTATHPYKGIWCINPGNGFNNTNSVGVATINNSDPATSGVYAVEISNTSAINDCPVKGDFEVFGVNVPTTESVDTGFIIAFI